MNSLACHDLALAFWAKPPKAIKWTLYAAARHTIGIPVKKIKKYFQSKWLLSWDSLKQQQNQPRRKFIIWPLTQRAQSFIDNKDFEIKFKFCAENFLAKDQQWQLKLYCLLSLLFFVQFNNLSKWFRKKWNIFRKPMIMSEIFQTFQNVNRKIRKM